jgi:hypothetical protein
VLWLSIAVQKGVKYSSEQSVLDFIHLHTMDDRQIAVPSAHKETFSWVFPNSANLPAGQQNVLQTLGE